MVKSALRKVRNENGGYVLFGENENVKTEGFFIMWNIIKSIIAMVLAYIANMLLNLYPNFPLSGEQFVNLILWLLAFLIPIKYAVNRGFYYLEIHKSIDTTFWDLVKTVLALIASYIFTMVISKYPNFPLTEQLFVNLIIWMCALFLPIYPLTAKFIKYFVTTWKET